ncbi:MAG: hypothetical protein U9R34_07120 [Nanoarchaeota archaeon]|nr:hypothetical protein [Nanoarchaeota archaeon]
MKLKGKVNFGGEYLDFEFEGTMVELEVLPSKIMNLKTAMETLYK